MSSGEEIANFLCSYYNDPNTDLPMSSKEEILDFLRSYLGDCPCARDGEILTFPGEDRKPFTLVTLKNFYEFIGRHFFYEEEKKVVVIIYKGAVKDKIPLHHIELCLNLEIVNWEEYKDTPQDVLPLIKEDIFD